MGHNERKVDVVKSGDMAIKKEVPVLASHRELQ